MSLLSFNLKIKGRRPHFQENQGNVKFNRALCTNDLPLDWNRNFV